MLNNSITYSQQSLDNYGFIGNSSNGHFRLNSLESNVNNYSSVDDWEFSMSLRTELSTSNNINLDYFTLGKRLNDHYLYLRYSPGVQQEFVLNSGSEIIFGETVQNYQTKLDYSEKYGFGYSYNFSDDFTIGFSSRYFQQEFIEEYPYFYFTDSANIIQIREEVVNKNYWRGDIGLEYTFLNNLRLSLSSTNLFILKDFDEEDSESEFEIRRNDFNLKQNKEAILGVNYFPSENWNISGLFETSTAFVIGGSYSFLNVNSSLIIGATVFHDKHQAPFITGISSSLNYSNRSLSITLSYLKYLSDRTKTRSIEDFRSIGIHNLQNNLFTSDRLNLSVNFALSFKEQKMLEFIDLEIKKDIFPNFKDYYIDHPIAVGRVVNLSDEFVTVKPSSFIGDINSENVYSPSVSVQPNDTVDVPFFIILGNDFKQHNKTKISQANFYLTTVNSEPDDVFQKPILVHDNNSWDGNVHNLRYFVKSDIGFSNKYALNILTGDQNINKVNREVENFEKTKILFENFASSMTYIADRRASVDHVQFPNETISLKGGDCDDLSVCFSSLLESVGIQTAFIDYRPNGTIGHVTLLINTNLTPQESDLITINDRKYFTRKNVTNKEEIWIPLEITSLTSFNEAWKLGAIKFYEEAIDNFGLSKNRVEIVDVY
jgi:hypothetical protein